MLLDYRPKSIICTVLVSTVQYSTVQVQVQVQYKYSTIQYRNANFCTVCTNILKFFLNIGPMMAFLGQK